MTSGPEAGTIFRPPSLNELSRAMSPEWIARFPELARLTPAEQKLITERAQRVELPAGTTVFAPGLPAENFLLLLDGTVRVQQVSAGGREIVLYRVTGGETCIMTTACLLSDEDYSAEGIAETEVQARSSHGSARSARPRTMSDPARKSAARAAMPRHCRWPARNR